MRMRTFRAAVTAALLSFSAFLLACPLGQLRLQIPDYFTSDVKGVQLYRVDDSSGQLVDAGRIEFIGIEKSANGEFLKYKHVAPDGSGLFGPVFTQIERLATQPNGIEVTLAFMNRLPSGWFKVASYNLIGTSRASAAQSFVEAGAES
jgi:hypothetical protein